MQNNSPPEEGKIASNIENENIQQPKDDQSGQPEPKPKKKKWVLQIAIICAVVAGLAVMAVCCGRENKQPTEPIERFTLEKGPNYSVLIQNWNQYASEYPAEFQLLGDRAASPQAVVDSFKKWCAAFNEPVDQDLSKELTRLKEEDGTTTFHKWEDFRDRHRQKMPLDINADMQSEQLAAALNSYLHITSDGRTPDSITKETVATIVKMNSLCQYFMQEKETLHKQQYIDTRIHSCQGLSTKGRYPKLDALIR